MPIEVEYLSGKIRRLKPMPLPPPATFFPPFSTDSSTSGDDDLLESDDEMASDDDLTSEALISQRANPYNSDDVNPGDRSLSSSNEHEEVDSGNAAKPTTGATRNLRDKFKAPDRVASGSTGVGKQTDLVNPGSSVATAGGAESGYSSSMEDDAQ
jgi:hypothetical protein